jgi:hypothetical protein
MPQGTARPAMTSPATWGRGAGVLVSVGVGDCDVDGDGSGAGGLGLGDGVAGVDRERPLGVPPPSSSEHPVRPTRDAPATPCSSTRLVARTVT